MCYGFMHVFICMCIFIRVREHVRVFMHKCVYVFEHVFMCLCLCVCSHVYLSAESSSRVPEAGREHPAWVLGAELRLFAGVAYGLNHRAICPKRGSLRWCPRTPLSDTRRLPALARPPPGPLFASLSPVSPFPRAGYGFEVCGGKPLCV